MFINCAILSCSMVCAHLILYCPPSSSATGYHSAQYTSLPFFILAQFSLSPSLLPQSGSVQSTGATNTQPSTATPTPTFSSSGSQHRSAITNNRATEYWMTEVRVLPQRRCFSSRKQKSRRQQDQRGSQWSWDLKMRTMCRNCQVNIGFFREGVHRCMGRVDKELYLDLWGQYTQTIIIREYHHQFSALPSCSYPSPSLSSPSASTAASPGPATTSPAWYHSSSMIPSGLQCMTRPDRQFILNCPQYFSPLAPQYTPSPLELLSLQYAAIEYPCSRYSIPIPLAQFHTYQPQYLLPFRKVYTPSPWRYDAQNCPICFYPWLQVYMPSPQYWFYASTSPLQLALICGRPSSMTWKCALNCSTLALTTSTCQINLSYMRYLWLIATCFLISSGTPSPSSPSPSNTTPSPSESNLTNTSYYISAGMGVASGSRNTDKGVKMSAWASDTRRYYRVVLGDDQKAKDLLVRVWVRVKAHSYGTENIIMRDYDMRRVGQKGH